MIVEREEEAGVSKREFSTGISVMRRGSWGKRGSKEWFGEGHRCGERR